VLPNFGTVLLRWKGKTSQTIGQKRTEGWLKVLYLSSASADQLFQLIAHIIKMIH
jgi:hypothetical protein